VVDEIERSLVDATSVVAIAIEDGRMTYGGGATATELAMKLRDYATTVGGREQIAIEAYAEAFEVIPTTLAENAGLDPIDILIDIRKAHKNGQVSAGVNVITGKVGDMKKERVVEPVRVGKQAIHSSTDAAVMILKIDDVIASKAKDMTPPRGGGAGGMGGMGEDY
jgi:chaperonin GroEL (HSP60 family)